MSCGRRVVEQNLAPVKPARRPSVEARGGTSSMPIISRFFGIVVYMNFEDHAPPHVHARYDGREAMVGIDPAVVLRGKLPPRVIGMLVEWATQRRAELLEDWLLARSRSPLRPIAPLA